MMRYRLRATVAAGLLLLSITTVRADVVWPALYVESRLLSLWVIPLGLIVELTFLLWGFKLPLGRAVLIDVVMNAASACLGYVLIPLGGLGWEFFPGSIIYKYFDVGTFNPVTWLVTCLIAVVVNTVIEASVMRYGFKVLFSRSLFGLLALANAVSVGAALASLSIKPLTL